MARLPADNDSRARRDDHGQRPPDPAPGWEREAQRGAEFRMNLGEIGDQIREQIGNWEESPLNPEILFGEGVPRTEDEAIRRSVERQFKKRGEFVTHLVVFAVINVLLWLLFLGTSGLLNQLVSGAIPALLMQFPWPMLVTLGWGGGLAAHAVETWHETGERALRRDRAVRQALRETYGDDWPQSVSKEDYHRLRRRVLKPYKKRSELFQHVAVFVPINLMLWMIYAMSSGAAAAADASGGVRAFLGFPWPILVLLGWGAGLVAHAAETYASGALRAGAHERAVQRAIERERALSGEPDELEKPKRDRLMRLGSDGELIELVEDTWDDEKPKRLSRS